MNTLSTDTLDAEDRKVYGTWLRNILIAYGAAVFCGIVGVAVQAMTNTTAEFLNTAIAMASP
jgi:hypothetical protein